MYTMKRPPDSTSYKGVAGTQAVSTVLDGGDPRVRADVDGAPYIVTAQWTCDAAAFTYLQAFYRAGTGYASQPFLVSLILENASLTPYRARIIPGTWTPPSQQQGGMYIITCSLWVTPQIDTTHDLDIMAAFPG